MNSQDLSQLKKLREYYRDDWRVIGSPCMRLSLVWEGDQREEAPRFDQPLGEAFDLLFDHSTCLYLLGNFGRTGTKGRKPQLGDRECFTHFSEQITSKWGIHYAALLDSIREEESETHLHVRVLGPTIITVSFGLDLYESEKEKIHAFVESFIGSATFDSGSFGFCVNIGDGNFEEVLENNIFKPVRRFPLLHTFYPGHMKLKWEASTPVGKGIHGLWPMHPWYFVHKRKLDDFGIDYDLLRSLKDQVFSVEEQESYFFIKAYEEPILGDTNKRTDLDPIFALAKALEKGFVERRLVPGYWCGSKEASESWYYQFLD